MGIGHPGDKRAVTNWVLGDFAKADADWLDPLLAAVATAAPDLVAGDGGRFASLVGQAAPAAPRKERPAKAAGGEAAAPPAPESEPEPEPEARSPLQRLLDRFR
jgi:peptidyl-tRNA hydrolase, PTH1 family